jgi:transcription elongation factor Elf1
MGAKFGKNKYKHMRGDQKVGSNTECPMCGEVFSKSTSYNSVSATFLISLGKCSHRLVHEEPRACDAIEKKSRDGK